MPTLSYKKKSKTTTFHKEVVFILGGLDGPIFLNIT